MADLTAVKNALAALAADEAPDVGTCRSAVADASAAIDDVRVAASFVDSGGVARLERAVGVLDREGDASAAREGRLLLARLKRYRRAAAGADPVDGAATPRGTVLPGDGQSPDR